MYILLRPLFIPLPLLFFVWKSLSPLSLSSPSSHRHAADTTATVVDLLPSVTTNSDPGTHSPASDSTTLTSCTASAADPTPAPNPAPQSSTPKTSVTSPTSPQAATAAVAPLVDLSDTPPNQTPKPSDSTAPTSADLAIADSTKLPGPKNPPEPASGSHANPPQSKDSVVQGGAQQNADNDLAKDGFVKPSNAPAAPNQDEYGHL